MILALLLVAAGFLFLLFGADWLVDGAASLALDLGVSPLIVGLTVVAYGTSMPELVVSLDAALQGEGSIAIGNVVGSNICTIGLVLGVPALMCSLPVQRNTIRLHAPIMILGCVMLAVFLLDSSVSRMEAGILFGGLIGYTILGFTMERRGKDSGLVEEVPEKSGKLSKDIAMTVLGMATVVAGGHLMVEGAVDIAHIMGISDAVIGLTVVALGTSVPDLTASAMAAKKGHGDIAVGNALGSVMFNTYMVMGIAGLVAGPVSGVNEAGVAEFTNLDLYVMVGIAALVFPMMLAGMKVRRWQGAIFVLIYVGYIIMRWPR